MSRLLEQYQKEVVPALMEEFGYTNQMQVPRILKIVVHMGIGRAIENDSILTEAVKDLTTITGQKPKVCRSKAPVAGFRLRAGQPIGCMVTLRSRRMYEFLDRLISFAIPRVRDFRGLSKKSFDGRGNYNFGITEQIVFPEVNSGELENTLGMDVTIVVSRSSDEESLSLLTRLGVPFQRPDES